MAALDVGSSVMLGVLEGLTEFIPVSSTGHLILLGHVLEVTGDKAETFEIFIQLGAILAVVVLYWKRFLGLLDFSQSESGNKFKGWPGILCLGIACLPVFIMGAVFGSKIKRLLFAPTPVAAALIIGGIVMIIAERRGRAEAVHELGGISSRQSFLVGLFQCLALWPGVSRSASTIIGGLLVGLDRKLAAEFSFLVAVPVMSAAVGFDLLKSIRFLSVEDVPLFGLGFVIAFVTALVAIKIFIAMLSRFSLAPFAWYRIVLGIVVLVLLR